MDSESQVFEIIRKKHDETDGKCGCGVPDIIQKTGLKYEDLRPILNTLFTKKEIKTRKGINGLLIFLYDKNRTKKAD